MARLNMLYRSGYAEAMIGESRRHLETSGLEHVGRFFWNLGFGASRKAKLKTQGAKEQTLSESRLMVELLPKATSFGRLGGKRSSKEHPANEKQKLEKS